MANPTTNFGWVMPTSSSLVTNLPADFNTFGQAVDTSMQYLLGGTTGQVLSKTSATNMAFTWVTPTDQTPLTTKGDLFTFTTVDARLAVGNNGETLVADSSTSTGLRYQGNYAAGLNLLINGDLGINQRNFTSNTTAVFNFDRWSQLQAGSGTLTTTPQVLAPATISGYGGTNYVRCITASQSAVSDYAIYTYQGIEDVRLSAGQTITISFYAKAASGTPKIAVEIDQNYGSGSPSGSVLTTIGTVTLSTSWARYTVTASVPSTSGKTINSSNKTQIYFWLSAGSNFNSRTGSIGNQNNTFEMTGFKYEIGNTATAFQTATGTIQGETSACQRYYYQWTAANAYSPFGVGFTQGTTLAILYKAMPVVMRTTPTITTTGTAANYAVMNGNTGRIACSAVPVINQGNPDGLIVDWAATGLTSGGAIEGNANNTTAAYVGFSAEL